MKTRSLILALVAVALAAGLGYATGHRTTTTTTTTTSSTSRTSSTSSSTTTVPAQPLSTVWPFAGHAQRFSDPLAAARSFAVDYAGFTNPVLGAFEASDSRSGEVPLRPYAGGPVSTVLVRQIDASNTWWVLGCASGSLQVSQPGALEVVGSPLRVSGQSTAYEAKINLELRAVGSFAPLVRATAMGGSMGRMGPFATTMSFATPAVSGGALVVRTYSAKDARVLEASVLRVRFR